MSKGLPITLTHLDTRLCLVVGGGEVAERKVGALLDAHARVRVIAPTVTERLAASARSGQLEWVARDYCPGDFEHAFLVIAATDNRSVNRAVAQDAADRHILVNAVDDPECSSFISPAVVRRGELTIAICTGGTVPALSGHLRVRLEHEFGPDWQGYMEWLARLRELLATRYPDIPARRAAWARVLASDLQAYIRSHTDDEIQTYVTQLLDS